MAGGRISDTTTLQSADVTRLACDAETKIQELGGSVVNPGPLPLMENILLHEMCVVCVRLKCQKQHSSLTTYTYIHIVYT